MKIPNRLLISSFVSVSCFGNCVASDSFENLVEHLAKTLGGAPSFKVDYTQELTGFDEFHASYGTTPKVWRGTHVQSGEKFVITRYQKDRDSRGDYEFLKMMTFDGLHVRVLDSSGNLEISADPVKMWLEVRDLLASSPAFNPWLYIMQRGEELPTDFTNPIKLIQSFNGVDSSPISEDKMGFRLERGGTTLDYFMGSSKFIPLRIEGLLRDRKRIRVDFEGSVKIANDFAIPKSIVVAFSPSESEDKNGSTGMNIIVNEAETRAIENVPPEFFKIPIESVKFVKDLDLGVNVKK